MTRLKVGLFPALLFTVLIGFAIASCGRQEVEEPEEISPFVPAPSLEAHWVYPVSDSSASSSASITNDGGFAIRQKGICWSLFPHPTISNARTKGGPGSPAFTHVMTNLFPGGRYYVRAYVTNENGTYYSDEMSFYFRPPVSAPWVYAHPFIDFASDSVTLKGEVLSDGGAPIISRGFVCDTFFISTPPDPLEVPHFKALAPVDSGKGVYSLRLTGLKRKKPYFVRAYAVNKMGASFSNQFRFTLP